MARHQEAEGHYEVTLLAAKVSTVALEVFDRYAPAFFEQPESEFFVLRLQEEIAAAVAEFMARQ